MVTAAAEECNAAPERGSERIRVPRSGTAGGRIVRGADDHCDNRPDVSREKGEPIMATKADFTEAEWETLHKGVTGTGMLVSVGDPDFTDIFGEAGAMARRFREEHEKSTSELVRELSGMRSTGFGLVAAPEKVEAETLEALRSATAILAAKAPEELDAYRQLVLDVAESVASAKGGVSPRETAVIEKIRDALGAS
jgi:hypothetical protein